MKRKIKKDEIQFENELLKLQARAEFGATVHSESDLPDEIENQFFKNVLKFERAHRQVKSVRVFDFIGKPEIKNIRSIKKNQLKNEMNRLLELFSEHNIAIDCICEVSDSDFYKFLSEELIHEEMDDFQATDRKSVV